MDEQHNGFDHATEPVEPAIDPTSNQDNTTSDETATPRPPAGREMLAQLQQMIDNISYQAAPVVRDIAAKAAELAAVAGVKAGPLAHKAADVTEQLGQRVATRSKTIADDLRRKNEPAAPEQADQPEHPDQPEQFGSTEPGPGDSTEQF